jgi:hypothetical protein
VIAQRFLKVLKDLKVQRVLKVLKVQRVLKVLKVQRVLRIQTHLQGLNDRSKNL